MRVASRSLLMCVLGCVVTGPLWPAPAAAGEESLSQAGSSLGGPLAQEGALTGSEELQAQQEATVANPETIRLNTESEIAYEGFSSLQSQTLADQSFPGLIDQPAGGPPPLQPGQTLEGFPTDNAMAVLDQGRHTIVESLQPIAVQAGPARVPIDLSLGEANGSFVPKTPQVGAHVRLPRHLGEGVALSDLGVELTPVDELGRRIEAAGVVDGSTVFYGGSEDPNAGIQDLSTLAKPTPGGLDLMSVLSSQRSPERLLFRIGLPEGASLAQEGSGSAQVIEAGQAIAQIAAPAGRDAIGRFVPLSLSVSGDVLTVTVARAPGEYEYPLLIDPYVVKDEQLSGAPTNWKFCASDDLSCTGHSSTKFKSSGWGGTGGLTTEPSGGYEANQSVWLQYLTQGESKIYDTSMEASGSNPNGNIESVLQLANSEKIEGTTWLSLPPATSYSTGAVHVCPESAGEFKCASGEGKEKNSARFEQSATGFGSSFADTLSKATVNISQSKGPEASFNTTPTISFIEFGKLVERENVLHTGSKGWLGPHSNTAFEVIGHDPGIGVSYLGMTIGLWELKRPYLQEGKCAGVQCPPTVYEPIAYASGMPDGEHNAEVAIEDATSLHFGEGVQAKIRIDGTRPTGLSVVGLPGSGVVNDAPYHLSAQATDGSGTTKSSGIKSLELGIDGFEIPGGKSGSCEAGPCTATGEWTLDGEEFGAGKHTLTLVATDNAGNKETKSYEITIRHARSMDIGPGSVDPITGTLSLEANDVSVGGSFGTLGLSRSYNSRQLTAGVEGPLGPQWSLSISGEQGIESEPTGGVTLLADDGSRTTFASDGKGGFISPKGDENLTLSAELEGEAVKAYLLKDPAKGTTVKFVHPSGASGNSLWVIEKSEGALSKESGEKQTYKWEMLEGVERPKEALAPAPPGVACEPEPPVLTELKVGCRALSFAYATETKASGEAPSEWSEYKGRLSKVSFTAYSPPAKAMVTTPIAEYTYDKQGRLRAEWDPRISPALKTTYGYDSEGHVVAVSSPGQEPWLLHYGTILGDPSAGRLLSTIRPPTSTGLGSGSAPGNESKPTLSTTMPVIGTTLSVASNGSWSNSPLAYGYQWTDCDSKGEKCTAIAGAVNESYTPQARDAGYTLEAVLTAINADGAGTASTAPSSTIGLASPKYSLKFGGLGEGAGQLKAPAGVAIDGAGKMWVADHSNNRIDEFSAEGTFVETVGWGVVNGEGKLQTCTSACRAGIAGSGSGELSAPDGLAINGEGIYVADAGNNRIEELNTKGEFVRGFGSKGSEPGQLQSPVAVGIAQGGNVWVADRSNNRIDEFTEAGSYIGSFGSVGAGNGQFKEPSGVAFSGEYAYVVDAGNSRVQQLTLSGNYVAQFGSAGAGNGQFSKPAQIATEPLSGDLFVADNGNSRIQEFNPAGTFVTSVGSVGEGEGQFKSVEGIATTSSGGLYAADLNNNRVMSFKAAYSTNNPTPTPPSVSSSAVSTVEYHVPVSGTGAPYAMSESELKNWGQTKDIPTEATAIFPPDEPMGWPAKDYTRANIAYFDSYGRTVNVASPSGGISTTEYNETNNIERTLSPADRVQALKEAKPAEAAKLLDTQSKYNAQGTELLSTLGPQHKVKLASGEEKQARDHAHDYYDEGAPGGETYNLLTKTTDGAEYESKETEVRTTVYSYSGQESLGWKLRKPTSVTVDPSGLNLTHVTVYDPATGNVTETKEPGALSTAVYSSRFGAEGAGNGQFKNPQGTAIDSSGNVWVTDAGNDRVQEFSSTGEYIRQFGSEGTGNGQLKGPKGIAIDSKGDLWVVESGNKRVQEFSSTGVYMSQFGSSGSGNGQFTDPVGIAIDPKGDIWITDTEGNNRVQEFSSTGVYMSQFGSSGLGNGQLKSAEGIAVDSKGDLWVSDTGNRRVQEFSSAGEYVRQFGSEGTADGQFTKPKGIAIDSKGNLWVIDTSQNRVQEFSAFGEYIGRFGSGGTGSGQFSGPQGIAVDSAGDMWVSDSNNNRVQEWLPYALRPVYTSQFGSPGVGNGQLKKPQGITIDSSGDVWVVDTNNQRVQEFSSTGAYIRQFGSSGTGNGQFKTPQAIAIDSKGDLWVTDGENNRVQEFTSTGGYLRQLGSTGTGNGQFKGPQGIAIDSSGDVWVVDTSNQRIQEFSATGSYIRQFGSEGVGNGQFKGPQGIAIDAKGDLWVVDAGSYRVQEFSSTGVYMSQFGSEGVGNGQFKKPRGITIDSTGDLWVTDGGDHSAQEFSVTGEYMRQFGAEGAGKGSGEPFEPFGIAFDSKGDVWTADADNGRVLEWMMLAKGAHESQTIYYSSAANATYPACGEHPEWANLSCRSQPAAQPDAGPRLPIVTDTYNLWDEPETVTEEFGSKGRTKKSTYDTAGRLIGSEVTSGLDTTLPKVADEYSSETGKMVKQSTTVSEKTQAITSVYNKLGQLTEYTDADSNKSTYAYDVDGRVQEMSDGKGKQTYAYDPTTGALVKLLDSSAGTFTAGYDVQGRMISETYPNGMSARYTYDEANHPTHTEYVKETHCTENCTWFSENVAYSIHDEALSRSTSLASETYTYDSAGRLTQVQETPVSKGCTTRVYVYDEDSNRLSLTTYGPNIEGKCALSAGTVEAHTYDEGDRLSDTGASYDALGNATIVTAADAGGHELTSTYYVSNQTQSTSQNGQKIIYSLDPDARSREIVSEGTTNSTVINHYPGPGGAVGWTNEGGEKYTRNIPGIDGTLTAVEQNGLTPVLQLHDLEGDIIATAALSETEAKLLSTYNSTEFGVPVNGAPPSKYSWLGASGVKAEFSSGATSSQGGGYVPQLGAALQTQPIDPPGAMPTGTWASGPYAGSSEAWTGQSGAAWGAEATTREATRQAEAARAAEEALVQCAYEGTCVTIEDPEPWIIYPNQTESEALNIAAETGNIVAAVSDVTGFVKDALESIAGAVAKYLIGQAVFGPAEDWLKKVGRRLTRCVIAMWTGDGTKNQRNPTCRIEIFTSAIKVGPLGLITATIPDFDREPEVSYCKYGTSWCYRK
jgi:YD repeat-containing protein